MGQSYELRDVFPPTNLIQFICLMKLHEKLFASNFVVGGGNIWRHFECLYFASKAAETTRLKNAKCKIQTHTKTTVKVTVIMTLAFKTGCDKRTNVSGKNLYASCWENYQYQYFV